MSLRIYAASILLLCAMQAFAQEQPATATADNPLAVLKDQLKRTLEDARLPFTDEQERTITLMMEDRRRASEELFGGLMDFKAGPTQGQESDRLRSAIEWMRNEFLTRVQDYLTSEQLAIWKRSLEADLASPRNLETERAPAPRERTQTQYVRINNNLFTAEDGIYRYGYGGAGAQRTEVIQRGGAGEFHGDAELLFKDESLNARNPFASNKPPYQERQATIDLSGPIIPGKLTTTFMGSHNEAKNVDTIHATLPDGIFALGIVRPTTKESFDLRNTYQLTDAHSISLNLHFGTDRRDNQGIGGFVMPDRAWALRGNNWNVELRQFSSFSPQTIYETRFNISGTYSNTTPISSAPRINVLDAFSVGGAQNASETNNRAYEFSNLLSRFGEKLTIKAGVIGAYRINRSVTSSNFGGTYTFSSPQTYLAGLPLNYRVNRGDPFLRTTQLEFSGFIQNDMKLTPRLTMMYGGRYDVQTNLPDYNNFGPRLAFAYALGKATVIRVGGGVFYNRLPIDTLENHRRVDGTHQAEIIVDAPSYPDPFQSGRVRTLTSRVTDPHLTSPDPTVFLASLERTFLSNWLLTVTYDYSQEVHRFRVRNLNAPMDIRSPIPKSCSPETPVAACVRPDPARGNVISLETTSNEMRQNLRVSFRQRFSIFNITSNYTLSDIEADNRPYGIDDLPADNYNLKGDYSRISGPLHTFSGTVNARMPLGLFLTGAVSAKGDGLYAITTGKDDNRDTSVNDRPPGAGRYSGKAPGFLSFDFNISKAFFLGDPPGSNRAAARKNVNFFANMTNAFNHLNYGNPSGVMTSPNFGKSTSAVNPREMEVGVRLQF